MLILSFLHVHNEEIQESANKTCSQHSIKSQHSEVHEHGDKDKEVVDQHVKELNEIVLHKLPSMSTGQAAPKTTEVWFVLFCFK